MSQKLLLIIMLIVCPYFDSLNKTFQIPSIGLVLHFFLLEIPLLLLISD